MDFYLQGIFLSKTKQTQLWDFELSLQALLYTYFTYLSAKGVALCSFHGAL